MLYAWVKVLHIVAVVAWMAGLFYLPRLFVYHADSKLGSEQSETFKVMERRLLRAIMNPAMIVVWLAGLALVWLGGWGTSGWLLAKVSVVVLLTAFHGWLAVRRRDFEFDRNTVSARVYRIANEVPTLLLIVIVALVVVKPF